MKDLSVLDSEVSTGRALLYNLCRSFFIKEPDNSTVDYWRKAFSQISEINISRTFNQAVNRIRDHLKASVSEHQSEYYHLFVDPYNNEQVHLTVSMYLEGRNYSKTLAKVKDVLAEAGIEAKEGVGVPEDYIPFLFEVMEVLINDGIESLKIQKKIFEEFLFPALRGLCLQLQQRGRGFYKAVGDFLHEFSELEREFFKEAAVATE